MPISPLAVLLTARGLRLELSPAHEPNPASGDKSPSDPYLSCFSTTRRHRRNLSTPDQGFWRPGKLSGSAREDRSGAAVAEPVLERQVALVLTTRRAGHDLVL